MGADLLREFLGRFGSIFDEVRNSELREAGDSARDMRAIQDLEYPAKCSVLLQAELSFCPP